MALTKLTSNLIEGGTGTDWVTAIQTSNFTAAAGKGYFVNTTSQVLYVNLPVGVVGTEIVIQDYAGTFGTNKVILNANGSEKIQGSALEGQITTNNATATLVYQDATKGWTSQDVTINLPPLTVDYLVVAGGGGGGGDLSAGGGAGGYLTNYGGTALTLSVATNYLVTTGAGGRGAIAGSTRNTENTRGGDGSNSVFYNITATGGGGGGVYGDASSSLKNGRNGGSGGGAGASATTYGSGGLATSSPTQGNNGGLGFSAPGYAGGGAGGAGAVGANSSSSAAGNGGVGLANAITGSSVFYSGGGGGSHYGGTTPGTGGSGGGGTGGYGASSPNGIGGNGTANTGGGGGGGSWNGVSTTGGAGGSGVVILRYPSSFIISGLSGTTTTIGTDKVTTFTNVGTGNIQFN